MTALSTAVDPDSEEFGSRRETSLQQLAELDAEHARAIAGGGQRYVERHRARGKLLVRERIELLIDPDTPFLELSALAGWGTRFAVGGSVVAGIGVVSSKLCLIVGEDPTALGGATNPISQRKVLRALDIAMENRLPLIRLVESGGADLSTQKELYVPGGRLFRNMTRLSSEGIPTVSVVFGNATAGGAYVPGMSDHVVMIRGRSKVFLGGPPLVKMATGEDAEDEQLGGGQLHATTTGSADYLAEDEEDALRLVRRIILRAGSNPPPGVRSWRDPRYPADQILGLIPPDHLQPLDPREVIARIVDDSDFDEIKVNYGTSLVTGWGRIHGFSVGILANSRGVIHSQESQKGAQFIQLANQSKTPLVFLQNTTGFMVGTQSERGALIKHGSLMINAVSNSAVPHLTIMMGASYGAGQYAMCGRAYDPRFLFSWPNSRSAVMGPSQLAGVMSIVSRQAAAQKGIEFDAERDAARTAEIVDQITEESAALSMTGQLYDDGIIDPRDTRQVLAICLEVTKNPSPRPRPYGVFRM